MTYTERERQPNTTTHDSIPAETGKNDGDGTSGDCISRQQAIDVLHGYFDGMLEADTVCPADIYGLFECMPSVQPDVIRCKDCKYCEHWYADKGRCFLWHKSGIDVFEEGFCNYAERRTDG